jgi:hypothetical protein
MSGLVVCEKAVKFQGRKIDPARESSPGFVKTALGDVETGFDPTEPV